MSWEDRFMKTKSNEHRFLWLVCGVVGGLCLAYFWPHEQAYAVATDRDAKFAICTVEVGPYLPEAVFVLDFNTGRLHGAMLNSQSGIFTNFWYANVAQDFKSPKGGGKFTIIPGSGFTAQGGAAGGAGGMVTGLGLIYVGELTSGVVGCYRFTYRNQTEPGPPMELQQVSYFNFRDSQPPK